MSSDEFRFGGNVSNIPPSILRQYSVSKGSVSNEGPKQHDRNQSLPSNALSDQGPVKVRPHRAATYSRPSANKLHPQKSSSTGNFSLPSKHTRPIDHTGSERLETPPEAQSETKAEQGHNNQNEVASSSAMIDLYVPDGVEKPPSSTATGIIDTKPIQGDSQRMAPVNSEHTQVEPLPQAIDRPSGQHQQQQPQPQQAQIVADASKQQRTAEPKTPSEYALHILFTQFVRHAEKKLNMCLSYMRDSEPPIDEILGEGVDPHFDKIISSLGHIAANKPKPVIDSVMFWRKSKAEAAASAAQALETARLNLQAQNSTLPNSAQGSGPSHSRNGSRVENVDINVISARENAINADKKSLISIFILCRVLMDIVHQTLPATLGDDLGEKLEEIVYKQLKTADPNTIFKNNIRKSNWNLFAALLGEMSDSRFASVGDSFIADLEKVQPIASKESEPHVILIIVGMRFLKLKLYPMDSLEESAEFLESIAKFFSKSQTRGIKIAYADVISQILIPLAQNATAELNHPTWAKAVSSIYAKSSEMMQKPKYWLTAYPLASVTLCVAPQELFSRNWTTFFEANISKLKDRSNRGVVFNATSRLLWVFTFRWTESLNNTTKKLDLICKTLLAPHNKKLWTAPVEKSIIGPSIVIIRIAAHAYLHYVLQNVIFQLFIGSSAASSSSDSVSLDNIFSERCQVAIRSFIFIICDVEQSKKPDFPTLSVIRESVLGHIEKPKGAVTVNSTLKPAYDRFCSVLGKLAVLLDTHVGAQSNIGDTSTPSRSQMAVTFHFGMDSSSSQIQKQQYFDLFKVVLEAIPWSISGESGSASNSAATKNLIDIIGRNTTHPTKAIADAAIGSLECLARTRDSVNVLSAYARLLFAFEEKLMAASEASTTATSDLERMLKTYADLVDIWVSKVRQSRENGANGESNNVQDDLKTNKMYSAIEEIEGNGLFFLCSHDRNIRQLAIRILKLSLEFDVIIGESQSNRVIAYMESADTLSLFVNAKPAINISMPERSRLNKLHSKKGSLVRLAESDYGVDAALWIKVFPLFIKVCFEKYPIPIAICRSLVCVRLVKMYEVVVDFAKNSELSASAGASPHLFILKHPVRTHAEMVVEQWRIYLVYACATLTLTDEQKLHIPDSTYQHSHGRKKSVQKVTIHHQRITSVRSLFRMTMPLLGIGNPIVRDAIVNGISSININIYKTLLECLRPVFDDWKKPSNTGGSNTFSQQKSMSATAISSFSRQTAGIQRRDSSASNHRSDLVVTEVVHLLNITSHYLENPEIARDEWIINDLLSYLYDIQTFISQPEVQVDYDYAKLRRYFCGLLRNVYMSAANPISFNSRMKFFILIEEWCSVGQQSGLVQERETVMKRNALASLRDQQDQSMILASIELEKRKFDVAVLWAMAALCKGNVTQSPDVAASTLLLNVDGLLKWINGLLNTSRDDYHEIGRKALKNLLLSNPDNSSILEDTIANAYNAHEKKKASKSYFLTFCDVIMTKLDSVPDNDYPCRVRQLLALGLFKIGDEDHEVRELAVKLLRYTEERFYGTSCIEQYTIASYNQTMAVYKRAMFNLSSRFSVDHSQETYMVFSELTKFFHIVGAAGRRDILAVVLPWIHSVELEVEAHNGHPVPASAMVMNNLFEITVAFGEKIQHEVEALWVALANGSYSNNVNIIMNYILHYSLERRDPLFVEYSRRILVYVVTTPAGAGLIEALIGFLQPKSMIPMYPEPYDMTIAEAVYPYVANILEFLPIQGKEASFSKGQLAMILLVDLILSPNNEEVVIANLALIMHLAFVLCDHYLPTVYQQARKLLIHIVHEYSGYSKESLEFSDQLLNNKYSIWTYDSLNNEKNGARAPKSMVDMVTKVLSIFSNEDREPELQTKWSKVALQWATTCPVRHIACRSFQIFRCLLVTIDQDMLGDMLARLSNTIADNSVEIQGFALQILMTLNAVTAQLPSEELIEHPQLFWATVACLGTVHEQEFIESLSILEKFLSKINLDSPDTVACLLNTFPSKWEGTFMGLQEVVLPGLRSSVAYEQTLRVLDQLNYLMPSEIVSGRGRLVTAIVVSLPRLMHVIGSKDSGIPLEVEESALKLQDLCNMEDPERLAGLSRILNSAAKGKFRSKQDFLQQSVQAIRSNFFPEYEVQVLVLLLGLLSNKIRWIKEEVMAVLKLVLPHVDMQHEELAGVGADLISPLLRLLQTDFAEEALSVLDTAISIPASSMDKHVLRMSLGNKAIRREYERTATLFGIPDESGWAVPMPAVTASVVRNNVHAVFYTCESTPNAPQADANDPDIITVDDALSAPEEFQFHKDEYGYYHGNGLERTDSLSIADAEFESASMSNMWTALDNLESFFTRDMTGARAQRRTSHLSPRSRRNGSGSVNGSVSGSGYNVPLMGAEQLSSNTNLSPSSGSFPSNGVGHLSIATNPHSMGINDMAVDPRDTRASGHNSPHFGGGPTSRFRSRFRFNDGYLLTGKSNGRLHDGAAFGASSPLSEQVPILENKDDTHSSGLNLSKPGGHMHSMSVTDTDTSADMAIDHVESVPQLYDKKVSLILNRSLARTPSTTSFKTSLADSFNNSLATPIGNDMPGARYFHGSTSSASMNGIYSGMAHNTRNLSYGGASGSRLVPASTNTSINADIGISSENESENARDRMYGTSYPKVQDVNGLLASSSNDAWSDSSVRSPEDHPAQESSFRLDSFLRASHIRKAKKKDKKKEKVSPSMSSPSSTSLKDEKEVKDHDKTRHKQSFGSKSFATKFVGTSSPTAGSPGSSPLPAPKKQTGPAKSRRS